MAGEVLRGRRARLVLAVPVSTPGDFSNVTTSVIELLAGDDALQPGNRLAFKISKTEEKDPNTAEITITNLSPDHRAQLQQKGVKVTLEAGYQATGLARIFAGDVRIINHVVDGADVNTTIKAGDGERSFRWAFLSESFAAGVGAGDVVRRLANASGLALGNVPTEVLNLSSTFDHGYAVHGSVQHALDQLLRSIGYGFSVQDGALQVLRHGSTLDAEIPEISPISGLWGTPEMGTPEKKGEPALITFQALIFPTRPGAKVFLSSAQYHGQVRVKKCEHSGDTRGGDWFTKIKGVLLSGK